MNQKKRILLLSDLNNRNLTEKMFELEDCYFSDMNLKKFKKRLGKLKVKEKNGKWETTYTEPLGDIWGIDLLDWVAAYFKRKPKRAVGTCYVKQKMIKIVKGLDKKEEKLVLLHEMIHAFEVLLRKLGYDYFVFIHLFERLEKKLGKRKIKKFVDIDTHFSLKVHSGLFLLKSLDLDIKLKKPLGAVYGYGREKFFK